MFDYHERRKIRSFLYSKFSIAIILILTIWLSTGVFKRYSVEREMAARKEEQEEELEALQQRAQALEANVDHLMDERGIEEELRNRFDVAKEGEQVVIILDDEDASNSDLDALSEPPGNGDPGHSFWSRFKFW